MSQKAEAITASTDLAAIRLPRPVEEILRQLNRAGYEAYVVGGCVRDALLGREPHDWDICTSAQPEQVIASFPEHNVYKTGIQHGTVLLRWEGEGYEITTFRTESDYSDHRHPDRVHFVGQIKKDLARRDFTINAMAYHPDTGVVDWFDGQKDLRRGLIRCVGIPEVRFQEDGLRILRTLRFGARYGFAIERETAQAMHQCKDLLHYIAQERIFSELKGILIGAGAAEMLRAHRDILTVFLPEIAPMFDLEQRNPHHCYDVWEHTLHALENVAPDPTLRLAVLFHDIGKPYTFALDEAGVGHCIGHSGVGAQMARDILTRLRCDRETMDAVVTLVEWHDRARRFYRPFTLRLLAQLGEERVRQLLQVVEADVKAQAPETVPDKMEQLMVGCTLVDALRAADACFQRRDLAIGGRDLIALGMKPSVPMGKLLEQLFQDVLDGTLDNTRETLLAEAKKHLAAGE